MKSIKNVRFKPELTEKAKKIYQAACSLEDMDGKFGKGLSKDENSIRHYILSQSPILGRIPSIEEINKEFTQMNQEEIQAILKTLDKIDVIHLDEEYKTKIVAAYPFSGYKTAHLIKFRKNEYKDIYSMCAVDALGINFMLNCDLSINSKCLHCNDEVNIRIEDNEIVYLNQENVVVWFDMEYSCCAATSLCKNINYFSSPHHFKEWQHNKPTRKGSLLQIQEAFYLGKLFFEKRLNLKFFTNKF